MDRTKTISILKSLANGIDPVGQKPLPPDSAIHDPSIIRALNFAVLEIIGEPKVELPEDDSKWDLLSQEYALWDKYCELKKNEDPHEFLRSMEEQEENSSDELVDYSEQYYEDEHDYSDSEYEANQKEILSEIYEDQENYARSEEEGWYHPDTEGSWEDNLYE
jgi:hypothetical protein